jgi:hypothetical protein
VSRLACHNQKHVVFVVEVRDVQGQGLAESLVTER